MQPHPLENIADGIVTPCEFAHPGDAVRRYQEHRAKLDKEESDQVAKTFSSESIRSLEFDGARRWAAEIRDQDLQAGILKRIDEKFAETANARPAR